jgi:hypothetical protein
MVTILETGLTGNETVPNITNVTKNATSSNISKALS